MSEIEHAALRDALVSSHMEGLKITPQTKQDCERLMNGLISVEELVEEILRRPTKAV